MCDYSSLYKSAHGYMMRCNKCRHIHIAFGNAILTLSGDQFSDFAKSIDGTFGLRRHDLDRQTKQIYVPTPSSAVVLLYSIDELELLNELLNGANEALHREQLFVFNYN